MLFQSRSRLVLVLLFVLLVVFVSTAVAGKRDSERLTVVGTESLGVVIIPNDFIFKDTAVGEMETSPLWT
jgi:hypothetical protein